MPDCSGFLQADRLAIIGYHPTAMVLRKAVSTDMTDVGLQMYL